MSVVNVTKAIYEQVCALAQHLQPSSEEKIAEEVYVATDCAKVMKDLGYEAPTSTYKSYTIMGKTFDPDQPEAYVNSFAIGKGVS